MTSVKPAASSVASHPRWRSWPSVPGWCSHRGPRPAPERSRRARARARRIPPERNVGCRARRRRSGCPTERSRAASSAEATIALDKTIGRIGILAAERRRTVRRLGREADRVKHRHGTCGRRNGAERLQVILGHRARQAFDHRHASPACSPTRKPTATASASLARCVAAGSTRNSRRPRRFSARCSPTSGTRPVKAAARSMKSP